MMTAVFAGLLIAALAGWIWQQMALAPLPTPRWALTVDNLQGAPPAGSPLVLERDLGTGIEQIGTAMVDARQSGGGQLVVGDITLADGRLTNDVTRVRTADGAATSWVAGVAAPRPIPIVEPVYVQAGAAALALLIGAVLVFRYVAVKRSSVEFLIATDGEMRKVNWSTKKIIIDSTWVVVGACFLLVLVLFLLDIGMSNFFRWVDLLQT